MGVPSLLSQNIAFAFLLRLRGDFYIEIRAELTASVEKSDSRGSRTNVGEQMSGNTSLRRFDCKSSARRSENIALHTCYSRKDAQLRRSPAPVDITGSRSEL